MSWAAHRQTTRVEDMAYCLMGIFDINMPLLYGEGPKAFQRLQEEILRTTGDLSVLAFKAESPTTGSVFSSSPADYPVFRSGYMPRERVWVRQCTMTHLGLSIEDPNVTLLRKENGSSNMVLWVGNDQGIYLDHTTKGYARLWTNLVFYDGSIPSDNISHLIPKLNLITRKFPTSDEYFHVGRHSAISLSTFSSDRRRHNKLFITGFQPNDMLHFTRDDFMLPHNGFVVITFKLACNMDELQVPCDRCSDAATGYGRAALDYHNHDGFTIPGEQECIHSVEWMLLIHRSGAYDDELALLPSTNVLLWQTFHGALTSGSASATAQNLFKAAQKAEISETAVTAEYGKPLYVRAHRLPTHSHSTQMPIRIVTSWEPFESQLAYPRAPSEDSGSSLEVNL